MRHNGFGETYCQSVAEARLTIENNANGSNVYCPGNIDPPEAGWGTTCEIVEDRTGDLVCYLEAPSVEDVRKWLRELDVPCQ